MFLSFCNFPELGGGGGSVCDDMKDDGKRFLRSELLVVSLLSSLGGEVVSGFLWVVVVLVGWFWGWAVLKSSWREMVSVWRRWLDLRIGRQHLIHFLSHPREGRVRSRSVRRRSSSLGSTPQRSSLHDVEQEFIPILPSVKSRLYGIPLPEMEHELIAKSPLNWSFRPDSRCISVSQLFSAVSQGDSGGGGAMDSSCRGKILLVEDTEINRILLRKLFKDLNLLFEEAENGQIAVDYFKQGKNYDLVLMDKEMPVMDGHEATRQLRLLGVKTPIVALTGNSLQSDKDMFFQAGADEFQTKPLSRAELVRLLDRYGLERPPQP